LDWPRWSAVFLAALALRAAHLVAVRRNYLPFDHLMGDAASYDEWGKLLAAHGFASSGVFYQDPLYPYLLGAVYRFFGYSTVLVRWLQIVLGSLNCVLISEAARRLFGRRAAWLAGALSAGYGVFIFYEGTLLKEGLSVFLSSLSLLAALWARESRRPLPWVLAGLSLGALMLTRGNAVLLAPVVVCWLVVFSRWPARDRLILTGGFLAGFFAILCPSAVHNWRAAHDLVLTTSQAGSNFYIGNHPGADGSYMPLVPGRQTPEYEAQDAKRLAEFALGRTLKPSEVSRYWFHNSLRFILDQPAAWLELLRVKAALFVSGYEIPDVEDYYVVKRFSPVLRLPLLAYAALLPLALAGMVLFIRRWRDLFFLYGFALVNALSVIMFYVFSRYRLPSIPPLFAFAAGFLAAAWDWLRARAWARLAAAGLAVAGLSWALAPRRLPLLASSLANLGTSYRLNGRMEQAVSTLQEAVSLSPGDPDVRFLLANLYMGNSDYDRAIPEYERVVSLAPGYVEAHYLLGVAYYNRHDFGRARLHWEEILKREPSHPDALKGIKLLESAHR
jgi:4-amino-4-deoxy-L-arabinose transferase-like glycosyltransferase